MLNRGRQFFSIVRWGKPEWAPHLCDVRQFCLYVDMYIYVSYILLYISIWSCKNGHHLRTVQYSQQTASDDMVIAWNKDNLQVTPLFNAHRNATEKISQQHSHFRIVIQKCVWWRIAYSKVNSEITQNCLELELKVPSWSQRTPPAVSTLFSFPVATHSYGYC